MNATQVLFTGLLPPLLEGKTRCGLAVTDDVLLMESGILPQFGELDEVFSSEALSRIYRIPIRLIQVDRHKQVLWTWILISCE
jgi:ABC-type cobalamin transport system ATPase subunit